jgi:hypothetical protein
MVSKKKLDSSNLPDDTSEDLRALFGANFRQARLKAKLTQNEVVARTGIRQGYISEVENGVRISSTSTIARASADRPYQAKRRVGRAA